MVYVKIERWALSQRLTSFYSKSNYFYCKPALQMSHLRDLQRLRNTKNSFTIKRNIQPAGVDIKLNEVRGSRGSQILYGELPLIADLGMSKQAQIDPRAQIEAYGRFLHSKEVVTAREVKERRCSDKSEKSKQHKRGSSFGGGTFSDLKPRGVPQSGLSLYNYSLKLAAGNSNNLAALSLKHHQLKYRGEKVSEVLTSSQTTSFARQSKELRTKKDKDRIGRNLFDNEEKNLQGKNAFTIMCPVGKGGFGKVWKVRCKRTGQIFAMKEMQKAKIINKKSIDSVMNERTLLADLGHPFLVNMKSSFQDRQNLYLVMDYLNGGDLRYHIGCRGRFNQEETKFFIANIILALEYLHDRKIIHRDLKPENFVFDSQGYLRLTDLGVSRIVKQENHTDTSGTPGYMAPQVICHKNHSFTADYFALGVMGYEFMLGRRPYNGKNRKEIREQILAKQADVKLDELPYKWSPKAADFISQLLTRNPQKRLGCNGVEEIKKHPWLADVDWKAIQQKTLKPTYIPLSIEQNYDDYKEQISQDSIDENVQETRMILRDPQVQALFGGYEITNDKIDFLRRSLSSTNHTDSELASLVGSGG